MSWQHSSCTSAVQSLQTSFRGRFCVRTRNGPTRASSFARPTVAILRGLVYRISVDWRADNGTFIALLWPTAMSVHIMRTNGYLIDTQRTAPRIETTALPTLSPVRRKDLGSITCRAAEVGSATKLQLSGTIVVFIRLVSYVKETRISVANPLCVWRAGRSQSQTNRQTARPE